MDTIYIRGLRLEGIIGIYDWERTLIRPLIFEVALGVDSREAAASDRMRDSVDYAAVSDLIRKVTDELKPQLLETLAEHIARKMFAEFPILSLRLEIDKPGAIPDCKGVGVSIERRREDYAVCGAR